MSLKLRLLLAGCMVLAVFVALSALALQRAVYRQAEQAEVDKLRGLVYALLGASDINKRGQIKINLLELPEDELTRPESGLYALIYNDAGHEVWRSPSYLGNKNDLPAAALTPVGEWQFEHHVKPQDIFELRFGFSWLLPSKNDNRTLRYVVQLQRDGDDFQNRLGEFGATLWLWLSLAAGLLMLVLGAVLAWGLRPLQQLSQELQAIENGEQSSLFATYPQELVPLTTGLNSLLQHERQQQSRYRNALDDLAHSLKTPLAVLQGSLDAKRWSTAERQRMQEQLARMNDIVGYQLRKAATAGKQALRKPVLLRPLCEKIAKVLAKVYRDKQIEINLQIAADFSLRADEGDLFEVMGALLDNACKYGERHIDVQAGMENNASFIRVSDDGPGFPAEHAEDLFQRGVRADSRREGQGIGLAVVNDIVAAYGGQISLAQAASGGALVVITLS